MTASSSLIQHKGVLLILFWVFLVNVCDPSVAQSIKSPVSYMPRSVQIFPSIILLLFYFLLPVITLVADIKFGGFRFTIISLLTGFLTSGLYMAHNLLDVYGHKSNPAQSLIFFSSPFHVLFRRSFTVFMVLHGTDLMPDASSEQLSSFIWWHSWCEYMGLLITVVVTCGSGKHLPEDEEKVLVYIDGTHLLCLLLILISCVMSKKIVETNLSRKINPVRLIKDVILFAKRHPFPLGRSAMTYWEDSQGTEMSRIDYGKKSYGGPFEEEDVESVKSFFRLLPFLACISIIYFPFVPLGRLQHSDPTTVECLIGSTYCTEYVVVLICISCRQLVPKCSQFFSFSGVGMLSRIGFGIFLILLSKITYVVTDLYVNHSTDNTTACFLKSEKNDTNFDVGNSDTYNTSYILILPQIVGSVGIALSLPTSLEFIFAQCPYSMRGLMIGLLFTGYDVMANLGWDSVHLYALIPDGKPGCEFYVHLTNVFVILGCFLVFSYLKRWYKLRLRNKVFFHYTAAEQYYTKLIRNRSEIKQLCRH